MPAEFSILQKALVLIVYTAAATGISLFLLLQAPRLSSMGNPGTPSAGAHATELMQKDPDAVAGTMEPGDAEMLFNGKIFMHYQKGTELKLHAGSYVLTTREERYTRGDECH
jgi:hypothetical protein